MRSKLLSSAKVLCYINGQLFGRVTSFRWTSGTPRKELHGIDSSEPYELAQTTTRIVGTLGLLRQSMDGGLQGPGVVAQFANLTREKYFTIALVDRTSDTVIFQSNECSVEEENWELNPKSLMSGTLTFKGITWDNEAKRQG